MKDESGTTTADKKRICEILNNYFKSVFVEEDSLAELPSFEPRPFNSTLSSITFDTVDIQFRLSKLDPHKAPGVDHLHSHVLSKCHAAFALPLTLIFNKSLKSGVIPEKWRMANVTPLHKKWSRSDPGNYRPVSLTSVACKLMERVIRDAMMEHLYTNNLVANQ